MTSITLNHNTKVSRRTKTRVAALTRDIRVMEKIPFHPILKEEAVRIKDDGTDWHGWLPAREIIIHE